MSLVQALEAVKQHWQILMVCMALFGLLQCFAGHLAWSLVLALCGAALGFVAGITAAILLHDTEGMIFTGALSAVVGGLLLAGAERVGTCLYSFTVAAVLTARIASDLRAGTPAIVAMAATVGVLCAGVVLVIGRDARIAISSIGGAMTLVWSAAYLLAAEEHGPRLLQFHTCGGRIGALAGAAIAGLLIQYLSTAEHTPMRQEKDKPSKCNPPGS